MKKNVKIPLKIAIFVMIFYVLCIGVAFCLRDDYGSYGRVLLHELQEQDKVDILYCGSSHVSHGIVAQIADEMTGKVNFSTGTAAQSIQGTYAILQQAVKLYHIEKVFMEMEFAISTQTPPSKRSGFKADYLVAKYIQNPKIKFDLLTSISTPKYYLNHFLPIGKDKYMTLNPKSLAYRAKSLLTGDYFKYIYEDEDDVYAGRGCLLDHRIIKNGSFSETIQEKPISISSISQEYLDMIDKIIALCKEYNIELFFYSMPCTDFYLAEKGNYDEYHNFIKKFLGSRGYEFYDFNLANEKYMQFEDEDFRDDNHFNRQGCYEWTEMFWNFFNGNIPKEEMFYDSYAERLNAMEERIFGLFYDFKDDKKTLEIKPITNRNTNSLVTYDFFAIYDNEEHIIEKNTTNPVITLPKEKSGKIRVISYLNGIQQNDCLESFTSF